MESFLGDDPFLNSVVFESLSHFKDLGLTSEEGAKGEIERIISAPRNVETCKRAAAIFGNQFEDIFQNHYYCAIDELEMTKQREFYIRAALGMDPDSLFLDAVLWRLVEQASPEAVCAFEKWAAPPRSEGIFVDEVGGVFLLAHIGLALTAERLPDPGFQTNAGVDEIGWRTWGEIIFCLHKPNMQQSDVLAACAQPWKQLNGPLLLASIDPWWRMEKYLRFHNTRRHLFHPVSECFASEAKILLEKALPRSSELTSLLRPFPDSAIGRTAFVIEMLGAVGDERSVLLLRPLIDSRTLGRSAVNAIREIRLRRTMPG